MVVQVVDKENFKEFAETGVARSVEEPEKAKVDDKTIDEKEPPKQEGSDEKTDEYGLTAAERKALGDKFDKIVGKRHKAMKEAQEAASDAEAFAQSQYQERKLAEKRADEVEARLKELESKAAPKKDPVVEPKPEDFKDGVEYAKALAKYESQQVLEAYKLQVLEETRQAEAARLDARRIERNKAFAKTVDDYESVIASLGEHDLTVPPVIAQYLLESDNSPQVMYHFAKNPDEFEAIAQLPPIKAIAAIGKLEAKLDKPKEETKEVANGESKTALSKAPKPIEPIVASTAGQQKPLAEMNTRETIEYWEARDKARSFKRQRH